MIKQQILLRLKLLQYKHQYSLLNYLKIKFKMFVVFMWRETRSNERKQKIEKVKMWCFFHLLVLEVIINLILKDNRKNRKIAKQKELHIISLRFVNQSKWRFIIVESPIFQLIIHKSSMVQKSYKKSSKR